MKRIEIVIADDHPQIRIWILKLINKMPEAIVVGEASNGTEAVQLVQELHPDLLLLDVNMPEGNGLEVMNSLRSIGAKIVILVLSAINDPGIIHGMQERGADGYLLKEDAPEKLVPTICELLVQKMADIHSEEQVSAAAQNKKKTNSAVFVFPN